MSPVTEGIVALYDDMADQDLVRAFTPGWPAGTKFLGPGTLPSWLWTDDDSALGLTLDDQSGQMLIRTGVVP